MWVVSHSTAGSQSSKRASRSPRTHASQPRRTISTFSCDIARPVSRRVTARRAVRPSALRSRGGRDQAKAAVAVCRDKRRPPRTVCGVRAVVLIGGPRVGKSTILTRVADSLELDGVAHAVVEVESLARGFPYPPFAQALAALRRVVALHRDAGHGLSCQVHLGALALPRAVADTGSKPAPQTKAERTQVERPFRNGPPS